MIDLRGLLPDASDAELDGLTRCLLPDGYRVTTLAELLVGWSRHVHKLESDLDLDPDDRAVWTEHDYVAALFLRDRVAVGLDLCEAWLRKAAHSMVAGVDRRFAEFTTEDSELLRRVVSVAEPGTGWWWGRVPERGPVLTALQQLPDPPE